jgi:O-methyltransferase involved in polyketide biosynthesis
MSIDDPIAPDTPSTARMYDYFLHGDNNFPIDRAAGDEVIRRVGQTLTRDVVWENRRFLGRAVHHLASECGVRQFIDVGAGLPSSENTHQVAGRSTPDARVVYVDVDPVVAEYGRQLLSDEEAERVRLITADIREPRRILDHPDTQAVLDFTQPIALLFIAVFHFIVDEEDPRGIVEEFRSRVVPGSYLAISHLATKMEAIYRNASAPMVYRDSADIEALFAGTDIVAPGLVPVARWRPDGREDDQPTNRMYGAVGRIR